MAKSNFSLSLSREQERGRAGGEGVQPGHCTGLVWLRCLCGTPAPHRRLPRLHRLLRLHDETGGRKHCDQDGLGPRHCIGNMTPRRRNGERECHTYIMDIFVKFSTK